MCELRSLHLTTTEADPTRPKQKYLPTTRVMLMSDTGTTHTMSLHDSARCFGTPSAPNWLNPRAINNARWSDFSDYIAIPMTADGVSCPKHTCPPTSKREFDSTKEAAMERQKQKPIVPESWPEKWEPSTWTSRA
jgi:hypothetical protein